MKTIVSELPSGPLYAQPGADATPESAMLFHITLATLLFATLVDFYLSLRQHRMYRVREVPSIVSQKINKLSSDEKKHLTEALNKNAEQTSHPKGTTLEEVLQSRFEKAQAYGNDKSTFGLFQSVVSFVLEVVATVAGLMPFMYDLAKKLCGTYLPAYEHSEIVISLVFVSLYYLKSTIIGLPFSVYFTFVIEERHGFNKQTLFGFFKDLVLQTFLGGLIGLPLIAAFIAVVHWGGEHFYLYASAFLVVVMLVMMVIYPNVIAPLFNTFTPLSEGSLRSKIFQLAESQKFPCKQLFVMDGSRRNAHSNAFFYGFWKNKRIVLYDTLLQQATEDEIVAILAHEIGHWQMNHTLSMMLLQVINNFIMLFGFSFFATSTSMYAAFGFHDQPVLIGTMLFLTLAMEPVAPFLKFAISALSRKWEYQADAYAHKLGYSVLLQKGLLKLHLENLSALAVDPLYSAFHYSHPPLVERLHALQQLSAKND